MKSIIRRLSIAAVLIISASHSPAAAPLDAPARIVEQSEPVFPSALYRAGISGRVVVEVTIDAGGKVLSPCVIEMSHDEFADAATESVKKWKFTPAMRGGRPILSKMRFPVVFAYPKKSEPNQSLQPTAPSGRG